MVRKLLILITLWSCKAFTLADPNTVERALLNETDQGFLSREFFQIRVEVPTTYLEISGKEKRKLCKETAKRNLETLTLPYLLETHRKEYSFGKGFAKYQNSLLGKERQERLAQEATNQRQNQTNAASTSSNAGGIQRLEVESQTTINQTNQNPNHTYSQSFAWFLDSLFLYKEDYSEPTKCAFLFRNIQKNLYERVANTPILEDSL